MRTEVLFFGVLAIANALVGCGQEDDASMQGDGLADAAEPSVAADAASDAGSVAPDTGASAALRPDAGSGVTQHDASTVSGPSDAGTAPGSDAGALGDGGPSASADASATGYSPCPSTGEACKILPLGDSITYGLGYAGGYRVELFRKANADKKKITFLGSLKNGPAMVDGAMFPQNNEGHSGWTISQVAGLVPKPALDVMPHIVLLMAGTNDINLSSDLPNAPKRLGDLIDKIIAANAQALIAVAQITPLSSRSGPTSPVVTYNKALGDVIATRAMAGKHVILVDMNTNFPANSLGDGVHPNQKGYEWMGGTWYEAIGTLLR